MATDLTDLYGTVKVSVDVIASKTGDLDTASDVVAYLNTIPLAFGSTTTLVDQIYTDTVTLASGATHTLDLYAGLTNSFGVTKVWGELKSILIVNRSPNTICTLAVAGNMCNMTGTLRSNETFFQASMSSLTATSVTASIRYITITQSASGLNAVFDIILIGTAA